MFNNEIKRYSFCGFSHNLIELFLIVGYENSFINKEVTKIIETNSYSKLDFPTFDKNENLIPFQIKTYPSILSIISSDFKYEIISLNLLIKYLLPSPPIFYYSEETNNNNIENKNRNYIFQTNSTIENLKLSFNAYCYNFYEIKKYKKIKIFIPKFFVILSQYQLFGLFNQLSKEIKEQFNINDIEIPLEIQIYNILNYIPAPIYSNESLCFFCYHTLYEYSLIKNENQFYNLQNQKFLKIKQISGYPFYDINICKIVAMLTPDNIIKVFLLILLEKQINVFCTELEILNIFILVLTNFNFPLDTMYNWSIVSAGLSELKNDDSNLIGRPNPNILGFNLYYNNKYEKLLPATPHFSLDLNNAEIYCFDSKNKDNNLKELYNYLNSILKKKNLNGRLEKCITNIYIKLKEILEKMTSEKIRNSDFFFQESNNVIELNKKIQNIFFEFYITVFALVYPLISIKKLDKPNIEGKYYEFDKSKIEIELNDKENNLRELGLNNKEEIFIQYFLESLKFDTYINYICRNSKLDMLETIYILIDELIILKNLKEDIIIDYISLFDILYNIHKEFNIETEINFYNFYLYYKENLQEFFANESNSEFIEKKIENSKTPITYKYNRIELDSSILSKYIHLIDNLKKEKIEEIFPSLKIKNFPPYIIIKENKIPDLIESYCIENKILELPETIVMCVLNVFICFIEKYDIDIIKNDIIKILTLLKVSLRKYIYRIIYVYYNLCLKQLKNKNYSLLSKALSFIEIFDHLSTRKILPNHYLLNLIEEILSLYYKELDNFENYNNNDYQQINNDDIDKLFNLTIQHNKLKVNKSINYIIGIAQAIYTNKDLEEDFSLNFQNLENEKEIKSKIYSPIKLLNFCDSIYNDFIQEFNCTFSDNFTCIIINILFYFQNCQQIPKECHLILKFLFNCLI